MRVSTEHGQMMRMSAIDLGAPSGGGVGGSVGGQALWVGPETDAAMGLDASLASLEEMTGQSRVSARGEVNPQSGLDIRGAGHGMLNAGRVVSRSRIAWRHVIVKLLSKMPGTRFKSTLTRRLLGVRMGRDVGLAYGVFLDPYDPSMISFGDNVLVGFDTAIFVHMFTLTRQRIRPVTIGNNVMIGAKCLIAPGVTIGDGASIAPGTVVSRDVPAGAMAMGNPMVIRHRGEPTRSVDESA